MLDLPATPRAALREVIVPALRVLPVWCDTLAARILLLFIALQESALKTRRQVDGPARGLWQCEIESVQNALARPVSAALLIAWCNRFEVPARADALFAAIGLRDDAACVTARMILADDPEPLPAIGDEKGAIACYLRVWRPGIPRIDTLHHNYVAALAAVSETRT